eukprot:scaffold102493_cov33-Phaeocystis_antarctica.AAC.1
MVALGIDVPRKGVDVLFDTFDPDGSGTPYPNPNPRSYPNPNPLPTLTLPNQARSTIRSSTMPLSAGWPSTPRYGRGAWVTSSSSRTLTLTLTLTPNPLP